MLRAFIARHKAGVSLTALIIVAAGAFGLRHATVLAAGPAGDKACTAALQDVDNSQIDLAKLRAIAPPSGIAWAQRGGSINDVSCLNQTDIYGVVVVRNVDDIARTLAFAREHKLAVSPAGVRHSMGGHAFRKGGIVLDLRQFNRITLNETARTVTVQPGATWHDIQNVLHPKFAVRAMQSTDIFTVGGSISVNAHGMDHRAGSVAGSIRSMRVMLADGTVTDCSRDKNRELFELVVGGYGLFGVIVEAELEVVDNDIYQTGRQVLDYARFPDLFAREIEPNAAVSLMYGHLSTAPSTFLREMLLYTYTKTNDQAGQRVPLGEPSATKLRRLVINLSKGGAWLKELKWWSEKNIEHRMENCTVARAQAIGSAEACFVSRNDPMHDSVPYLRNSLPNDTDILHEYFIPRSKFVPFVDGMRKVLTDNKANLLNASVRIVHKEENALNYAPEPAFAVVLYLNQSTDEAGNAAMKKLTGELIELTLSQGGRFFLPYQLYYSDQQLKRSYPEIAAFFRAKRTYDPDGIFTNTFHQKYGHLGS